MKIVAARWIASNLLMILLVDLEIYIVSLQDDNSINVYAFTCTWILLYLYTKSNLVAGTMYTRNPTSGYM